MRADHRRHDPQPAQHLAHLLRLAEHDLAVLTVPGPVKQIVGNHHRTGARFGRVLAYRFQVPKLPASWPVSTPATMLICLAQPRFNRARLGSNTIDFFEE